MLERIEGSRSNRHYYDHETSSVLSVSVNRGPYDERKGRYAWERVSLCVTRSDMSSYMIEFKDGRMHSYCDTSTWKRVPLSKDTPERDALVERIIAEWRQGPRRELFMKDDYARENMPAFRELWDEFMPQRTKLKRVA